ncbi:MAG TPA: helix-turn-helix domain-containing protein, partial [Ktedonobacterales bacterium]|nr:helix-turn-helix domain-containing protein [Ktedonobacterales bacterium]
MTIDRISSDRRTEILEAAVRVLARDGLAQASTRKLAAEAGINQATLLYHVGSKDQLLLEVLREMMRQTREIAVAAAQEDLPLREAITNS